MLTPTPEVLTAAMDHAAADAPREACGVIVVDATGAQQYRPCRNIAVDGQQFILEPNDFAAAEDAGRILSIVHSHCFIPGDASMADRLGCEKSGLPWIIVQHPNRTWVQIAPTGYRPPLLARPFLEGVLDCYSLIRDYYHETLGLTLPDFARTPGWERRGEDLYVRNFARAGFRQVGGEPQAHDVILMQIAEPCSNHGAVYLGDDLMMHHLRHRLSERAVYGGFYRQCTTHLLRHQSRP